MPLVPGSATSCTPPCSTPSPTNPFPPAATHLHSEADLAATGVAWTVLRNALYADLRAEIAPNYVRAGRWVTNIGSGAHAFVARADCSAAAAAVLVGDGHEGHRYDITGPELIDASGFLAMLNRLADRPIDRIDVDDEAYERYRVDFVTDPAHAGTFELFTGTGRAIRAGWLNVLSDDVGRLTGRTPTALRDMPPFSR